LWHRKSGAGFRLFAEFYASQPIGICSSGNEDVAVNSLQVKKAKNSGQSRASIKRRKKKKTKANSGITSDQVASEPDCAEASASDLEGLPITPLAARNDTKIGDRFAEILVSSHATRENRSNISSFLSALSRPLPLTFRIRRTVTAHDEIRLHEKIAHDFGHLVSKTSFDSAIYQATTATSCPTVAVCKATLAKVSPELKAFLVTNSGTGTVARQELASMLPVLALSRGGWLPSKVTTTTTTRVLDLCAAPGSKTLQALELVGTKGRVRANDVNAARLGILQAAVERAGLSTSRRVKYTNVDATRYPIPKDGDRLYDTVLCDVPCSGDGTIRKDPCILPNWTPAISNTLHALQLKILLRALQLLKVGGVLCYSTCSLNPVEDEAVVAAALTTNLQKKNRAKVGGKDESVPSAELVPWPEMDGLQCRPGVEKWKIFDYLSGDHDEDDDEDTTRLRWHASYQDAVNAKMENAVASMWPPVNGEYLHLNRCIRLWPQDNDSGGFFVALIRKNW
jgi:16S rRNA C967 or C1407 C5-methylase (RsmB/RsmF family)